MSPPSKDVTAAIAPTYAPPGADTTHAPERQSNAPALGVVRGGRGRDESSSAPAIDTTGERSLILAAQRGETEAFSALVRLHQRRAYAVARAIVITHEDAEDVVQDAFLHAYKALHRFLPDQSFGAWLHRIVANAALDLTRRRKVRDADELTDVVSSPFRDPGEARDLRDRLRGALALLGERQRSVIVLHDVEGFKHAEIGAMLGIPEGTARSDLHHARSQLRRALGDFRRDA